MGVYFDIFALYMIFANSSIQLFFGYIYYNYINVSSINNYKNYKIECLNNFIKNLQSLNVYYLKFIQAICSENNLLSDEEQEFLIEYTDNIPFTFNDINFKIITKLKSNSVIFDSDTPINSGTSALVYKGTYKNNNVAIKILKNNALKNIESCLKVFECLSYYSKYIPYIRLFNLYDTYLFNRKIMLDQVDLFKEKNNIIQFKSKFYNHDFVYIPQVYNISSLSNIYQSEYIIMEYIDGISVKQLISIKNPELNYHFSEKQYRLAMVGILLTGGIHCDLHAGNFIVRIFDKASNKLLNYKEVFEIFSSNNYIINDYNIVLGLIDFGLVLLVDENTQNIYYNYLNNLLVKNDYLQASYALLDNLCENYDGTSCKKSKYYNNAINQFCDLYALNNNNDLDLIMVGEMCKILNTNKLKFKDSMLKIQLSLVTTASIGKKLLGNNNMNALLKSQIEGLKSVSKLISFD